MAETQAFVHRSRSYRQQRYVFLLVLSTYTAAVAQLIMMMSWKAKAFNLQASSPLLNNHYHKQLLLSSPSTTTTLPSSVTLIQSSSFAQHLSMHRGGRRASGLALTSESSTTTANNSKNNDKKKNNRNPKEKKNSMKKKPMPADLLDESVRDKLLKETIAPWRSLRLFLYASLGSGALVGGLITLSGTLAALSGVRSDLDLDTEYLNLAIDFGAVTLFAVLAKLDLDQQAKLDVQVDAKIQKKKERASQRAVLQQREGKLASLPIQVRVSATSNRVASIQELQRQARQHVIVVAGPKKACRDALVGANLLKMDFALSNVLVVPYETDRSDPQEAIIATTNRGFGKDLPVYETQPYVARPADDAQAWKEYVDAEMKDAIQQNGPKAKEEGIAIVINSTGKILRRGVGKVPWRQIVEELEASIKVDA